MRSCINSNGIGFAAVTQLVSLAMAVWCAFPAPTRVEVQSTMDGQLQQVDVYPAEDGEGPRPLLVVLHNWSADLDRFDGSSWVPVAKDRNWHMIFPDFRGANNRPEACGSMLARQDVLDAVEYAIKHYDVDASRVYLAGVSGGGHMAMVLAAHAPDRWTAVSAWAGISDLAAWHVETKAANRKYWRDIEAVVGGAPGESEDVDADLRLRSPVHHLANAKDLPVEIAAGIHDGYTGSVPIHHSIDAFNAIARALDETPVDAATIDRLSRKDYAEPPEFVDASYGRGIHLRQTAGASRVTIFEGGHEGIPAAAAAWLAQHARDAN